MDKAVWDNNDELRRTIERELDNWGAWSRQGNGTNLGHRQNIPGAGPPQRDPPRPANLKMAEASEYVISTWCATTEPGKEGAFLLKAKYVERLPLESVAAHYRRKFKSSRSDDTVAALIDESEWFYWLLTS